MQQWCNCHNEILYSIILEPFELGTDLDQFWTFVRILVPDKHFARKHPKVICYKFEL